jgi:hypothetical protein
MQGITQTSLETIYSMQHGIGSIQEILQRRQQLSKEWDWKCYKRH